MTVDKTKSHWSEKVKQSVKPYALPFDKSFGFHDTILTQIRNSRVHIHQLRVGNNKDCHSCKNILAKSSSHIY